MPLSRFMNAHQKPPEDPVVAINMETEIISVITTTVRALPVTLQMVQEATHSLPPKWPTVQLNK